MNQLKDFKIGDSVCAITPDGEEGECGVVVGINNLNVQVKFDDDMFVSNVKPFRLRNFTQRKNERDN